MIYSRFASTETGSAVASCLANAWRIVDRFTSFTHVYIQEWQTLASIPSSNKAKEEVSITFN
jgi:hypothetical protein